MEGPQDNQDVICIEERDLPAKADEALALAEAGTLVIITRDARPILRFERVSRTDERQTA